jgi:biotin transporter BioY
MLRHKKKKKYGVNIWTLVLMLACFWLVIVSTFVQFTLPGGEGYRFIPQIPVILFTGALLGRRYALVVVVSYIITGLFFEPVFALGGGLRYVFEYGFGYIMAYLPAVFFSTSILQSGFTLRNTAQAALVGVLSIHIIGITYMLFLAGINHEGLSFMYNWIISQSGMKIVYDLLFSFAAVLALRYLPGALRVW